MLFKKLIRTAAKYKAQFISMIVMVAIGMGVFMGFNSEWYSLQRDTDYFLEATNYADYRIYNDSGFSSDDISAVEKIEGVDAASRFFAASVSVKGKDSSLSLTAVEKYNVSTFYLMEGSDYDEDSEGIWISDKFADKNDIKIGDTITLAYRNIEMGVEVVGLIKSGEYMICVAGENQLMPDFSTYGFAYVSPKKLESALGFTYYPQINILSSLEEDDIEQKINSALGKTTLLLSKDSHSSYAAANSEVEEGRTMGNILPVLFLAIAVLTMITTMHRITANEKTQIGTLKALGFRDKRITRHYTSYGFALGLVGTAIGIGFGYGISALVINPNMMQGIYFDMPVWNLYMPWFCWVACVAAVGLLTLIGFLSVKKMLKGTAADSLRPYTPKRVKPLAVEKTKVWSKFSFGTRWNLRDLFRHKSRSIMALIGIVGCTILTVGAMGMNDTMNAFLGYLDSDMYLYNTRVNFTESITDEQVESFSNKYKADILSSVSGEAEGKSLSVEVYDIKYDMIGFIDEDSERVKIGDDGAYICVRLADKYSVGDNISFSPYGDDKVYTFKVAGVIRSVVSENITLTRAYAESVGLTATYQAAFTMSEESEIESADYISGTQTKQYVLDTYDSFNDIMNMSVSILIIAAVLLGFIVLYNLGVMSYIERYRELATLKVVGFKNKRIGGLLISQNLWLTLVGVILGIPGGIGVLNLLIVALASEYELALVIYPASYIICVLVPIAVSLVVGLFVARKNKRIDMVEALKGAE